MDRTFGPTESGVADSLATAEEHPAAWRLLPAAAGSLGHAERTPDDPLARLRTVVTLKRRRATGVRSAQAAPRRAS